MKRNEFGGTVLIGLPCSVILEDCDKVFHYTVDLNNDMIGVDVIEDVLDDNILLRAWVDNERSDEVFPKLEEEIVEKVKKHHLSLTKKENK